jgi:hypothetical protein
LNMVTENDSNIDETVSNDNDGSEYRPGVDSEWAESDADNNSDMGLDHVGFDDQGPDTDAGDSDASDEVVRGRKRNRQPRGDRQHTRARDPPPPTYTFPQPPIQPVPAPQRPMQPVLRIFLKIKILLPWPRDPLDPLGVKCNFKSFS